MLELVPTLKRRKKWQPVRRNMKVSEVVLVISADVPHGQWSFGRVVDLVEGDDGSIEVVNVQVGGSVATRSITKICPLEVNKGDQDRTTRRGKKLTKNC